MADWRVRLALACCILVALGCLAFGMWELALGIVIVGVVMAVPKLRDYWLAQHPPPDDG